LTRRQFIDATRVKPIRLARYACAIGMLFPGLYPAPMVDLASQAVAVLKLQAMTFVQ
jgi:hypothetical protein